jgi:hypothetical protein
LIETDSYLVKCKKKNLDNISFIYFCFAGSFLVLHLSDLIRMSFIAATSDSNQLRLAGMAALEVSIATVFVRHPLLNTVLHLFVREVHISCEERDDYYSNSVLLSLLAGFFHR